MMKKPKQDKITGEPGSKDGAKIFREAHEKMNVLPKAAEARYFYGTFPKSQLAKLSGYLSHIIAVVREKEGVTAVFEEAAKEPLSAYSEKKFEGPFALITLSATTDLQAVGITAAVSSALAKEKISANVFAGYYHDHILVPYESKEKAVKIISML